MPDQRRRGAARGGEDTQETELARENARLRAEVDRLRDDRAELSALAAFAAHEVIQPLLHAEAVAAAFARELSDAGRPPGAAADLEAFRSGTARARRFAEALLRDAQAGERGLERRPVDTHRLAEETAGLLAVQIADRGVGVEIAALPEVRADAVLLGGVFMNLFTNALKYGPQTGGRIRVSAEHVAAVWRFRVASAGRPIEPPERDRLFRPFVRGTAEHQETGTGLGLALCRRIVERHGGEIGIRPLPGWGNAVEFTLPD
jgi:signal transduction histidine kinase